MNHLTIFLSTYYISGSGLGAGDITVNKADVVLTDHRGERHVNR